MDHQTDNNSHLTLLGLASNTDASIHPVAHKSTSTQQVELKVLDTLGELSGLSDPERGITREGSTTNLEQEVDFQLRETTRRRLTNTANEIDPTLPARLAHESNYPGFSSSRVVHSNLDTESAAVMHAQDDGNLVTSDELQWYDKRKNLEALKLWLHFGDIQELRFLSRMRAEEDVLLASMVHQRTQAEAECSNTLTEYKNSLDRIAKLLIQVDLVHMQIDELQAATDVDLTATVALRAEIARHSRALIPPITSKAHSIDS